MTQDSPRRIKRTPKPKIKLTKKAVEKIPLPSSSQIFFRDTEIPGLGLRVTPGAKTFVLEKFIQGRCRRLSLGQFPSISVDKAREEAIKMTSDILSGKDPAEERIARRTAPTFGNLVKLYRERYLPRKKSAKNDEIQIKAYLDKWTNRKLSSIRRKDVAELHLRIGQNNGHYTANRLIALLRKMFNLAATWGIFQGENPATRIEMFQEKKRERFVHPDELPRLLEALKNEENIYIRTAFLVCLLTGARKGEVLSMRWEDINLDQGTWTIPETKAGRSHLIPLPSPVVHLLKALPLVPDNPFVFPGGKKGAHLVNISKAWNEIKAQAKLQDVRIHDLRRTVGSWLAGSGASLPLIGKVLNHSQPSTTAIYARLDVEPVRAALEANAQRMLLIAEKPEGGKGE